MRARKGAQRHQKQKQVLKSAKGYRAARSKHYRKAKEAVKRAEHAAYVGRKQKKRDMRRLWITRINIASRDCGLPYSRLIAGLQKADIRLDRRQLSELAINEPAGFGQVVEQARQALA